MKARPNGEGDVVIGDFPSKGGGDFPPIIFTTGDKRKVPDVPEGRIVYKFRSLDDRQENYHSGLRDALDKIMKWQSYLHINNSGA